MPNMRNMGVIGKNMPANGQAKAGLFNQSDLHFNRLNTSAGSGYLYALSYIAVTGGTLTIYDGGADITATLDSYYNSTSGDALFLPAGSYTVDSGYNTNFTHSYCSSVFPSGFYGVFGSDPQDTIINAVQDASVSYSDNCIVAWDDVGDIKFDGGYFTLRFKSFGGATTSYAQAMFTGTNNNGDLIYAQFKNCAFNRDNTNLSLFYDNGNDTGFIWFKNCSIGNVQTFYNNYSGSKTNKAAFNCLFEPNVTTTQLGALTDCVVNGNYFTINGNHTMTYDTTVYNNSGHLIDRNNVSYSVPS